MVSPWLCVPFRVCVDVLWYVPLLQKHLVLAVYTPLGHLTPAELKREEKMVAGQSLKWQMLYALMDVSLQMEGGNGQGSSGNGAWKALRPLSTRGRELLGCRFIVDFSCSRNALQGMC